jgi:hypothetical protein
MFCFGSLPLRPTIQLWASSGELQCVPECGSELRDHVRVRGAGDLERGSPQIRQIDPEVHRLLRRTLHVSRDRLSAEHLRDELARSDLRWI